MKDILNPAVQRINFQYTPNPPSTSCLNNATLQLEHACKLPLNQATLSSHTFEKVTLGDTSFVLADFKHQKCLSTNNTMIPFNSASESNACKIMNSDKELLNILPGYKLQNPSYSSAKHKGIPLEIGLASSNAYIPDSSPSTPLKRNEMSSSPLIPTLPAGYKLPNTK